MIPWMCCARLPTCLRACVRASCLPSRLPARLHTHANAHLGDVCVVSVGVGFSVGYVWEHTHRHMLTRTLRISAWLCGISVECIWYFCGISVRLLWDTCVKPFGFCRIPVRFLLDFCGIFLGSLWDFGEIPLGCLWDSCVISMGFLWGIFGISLGSLWDLGKISMRCMWVIFLRVLNDFSRMSIRFLWNSCHARLPAYTCLPGSVSACLFARLPALSWSRAQTDAPTHTHAWTQHLKNATNYYAWTFWTFITLEKCNTTSTTTSDVRAEFNECKSFWQK